MGFTRDIIDLYLVLISMMMNHPQAPECRIEKKVFFRRNFPKIEEKIKYLVLILMMMNPEALECRVAKSDF